MQTRMESFNQYTPNDYLKLSRASKRLSETQFDAVMLRFVEHNTIETVARVLELGWQSADEVIEEALELLRDEWRPEDLVKPAAANDEEFPPCLLAAVGVR